MLIFVIIFQNGNQLKELSNIINNYDYWLDFIEGMKSYWDIDKYLFILIKHGNWIGRIPSTRFWGITFLFLQLSEIKIVFKEGDILTPQNAFNEMEDCYIQELKQQPLLRKIKRKLKKWWYKLMRK